MAIYVDGKKIAGLGSRGEPGKSAYQQAVEGGYTGTEEDFKSLLADIMPRAEIEDRLTAIDNQLNGMSVHLYVSINGSDETGDGTQDKPYRTVQKAVDAIKPYHTNAIITIGPGVYDEDVTIANKTATITLSSAQNANKAKLKYVYATYCRSIWLDYLGFNKTDLSGDLPCINIFNVQNATIRYCEISGNSEIYGISSNASNVYVANTSISNCGAAILTTYNSLLTARLVSGDNNQIGYSAHSSILNVSSSTLQAATLTEKRNGGIIYKDGVQV